MDRADPLLETAIFGQEVEAFLQTNVGRYVINRAEAEGLEANENLKTVAPWRTRRIRDLQNQIKVAESVQSWLGQAVADGISAQRSIEEGDGNG